MNEKRAWDNAAAIFREWREGVKAERRKNKPQQIEDLDKEALLED